jgi:hypothetical protein
MATSDADGGAMDLLRSTWKDIEAYLGRSQGIIVALGSIEQHGPRAPRTPWWGRQSRLESAPSTSLFPARSRPAPQPSWRSSRIT